MTSNAPTTAKARFNPDELHKKYLAERDRRLRADGSTQYVSTDGEFAAYLDDPNAKSSTDRSAVSEELDALVIGGGFSGLMASARLREQGVSNFRIIDNAADFGGTWYWNRYPGAACDVESYIYMPMLEEMDYMPTMKYAQGPEIYAHCQAIGERYDLYSRAYFQTQAVDMRWDSASERWWVTTDKGDTFKAKFVCLGMGPFCRPKLPGIPGIEKFKGHSFHTCRWDFDYTGGDSSGNLTNLKNKRVGIIGTGATAVQCIPHLAEWSKKLVVFQRTPASVDVRNNQPTDPDWWKTLPKGWQHRRMENFDAIISGIPQDEDLVADSWTDIWRNLYVWAKTEGSKLTPEEMRQMADYEKMESVRQRVENMVADPDIAESLKPYYNQFCKRPCYHDEYLQTYNRENVELVDTRGKGVDQIVENGIVADGKLHELDCIIFSTGFDTSIDIEHRSGLTLRGRDGIQLKDKWASGVRSLHGIQMHGFPNLFLMGGVHQTAVTINFPYILGEQCRHFAETINRCLQEGISSMEVTKAAEDRWCDIIEEKSVFKERFSQECTPGFYNNEGKVGNEALFANIYGGGPIEYINLLQEWRSGDLTEDMLLSFELLTETAEGEL